MNLTPAFYRLIFKIACCAYSWTVISACALNAQTTQVSDSLQGMIYLQEAAKMDKLGRFEEGIILYKKSIPLFKKGGHWYYYFKAQVGIAYSYLDGNRYLEAKDQIQLTLDEFNTLPEEEIPYAKLGDAWLCKGNIHNYLFEFEPALSAFENALSAYRQLPEDHEFYDRGASFAYNNMGSVNLRARNFPKALEYLTKAFEMKKKVYGPDHQRTLNSMYLLSETWSQMGFLNKALDIQKQILEIEKKDQESDGIAHCFREMSKVFQYKKDFKTAEEYIRRAIDFYEKSTARTVYKTAICEHQLGNVLKDGGQLAASIPWFKKAIKKHNQIHGGPNYDSGLSTMNIGKAYTYMGQFEKGLEYYEKAADLFKASVADGNPRYVELWTSMGVCYYEKGDIENANKYFSKSYNLAKQALPKRTYDRAQSCYHLTKTTGDLEKAIALCQEGLEEVSIDFIAKDLFGNPAVESIFHEQAALILFEQKIKLLEKLFHKKGELVYLKEALRTTETASQLVDLLRQNFYTESAKTDLAAQARKIYETGIQVIYELSERQENPVYLELAFQLMENSRNLVLLEEIHEESANQLAKIPDSLAFKRTVLRKEILHLETQFQLAKDDTEKSQAINKNLFTAKEKFQNLEKQIEKNYPEISALKNNLNHLNISAIQQNLKPGEALLEYLLTDENLFAFYISPKNKSLKKTELKKDFQKKLISFIQSLKDEGIAINGGNNKEIYKQFISSSNELHALLIGDILQEPDKKLIIVPDLWLSYLPFEILLENENPDQQNVDYATLPYLFKSYPIRYAFSANLQFNEIKSHNKHNQKVLAYAPEYTGSTNQELTTREGFSALTQTVEEVADIQELLEGTIVTGTHASEVSFKKTAREYGILHLAMHAFTDEENPMISGLIFSDNEDKEDDVLRAYELQGMQLNAQLAVLSACNTGSGKLERGEGIMSLGRGFRRAGVPNILMSLWQVDDESTRKIMGKFYSHIKSGTPTDEALQQAKLEYLEESRKAYPFFWSAFILMGDNEGLEFVQFNNNYFSPMKIGLFAFLLLGALFVFGKMRTR